MHKGNKDEPNVIFILKSNKCKEKIVYKFKS